MMSINSVLLSDKVIKIKYSKKVYKRYFQRSSVTNWRRVFQKKCRNNKLSKNLYYLRVVQVLLRYINKQQVTKNYLLFIDFGYYGRKLWS